MRQLRIFLARIPGKLLLPALIIFIAGCSLEKQSGFNRSMQNLTAHYNILFNANELLRIKQETYAAGFIDSYNELLSVYPDTAAQTTPPDKDLELAITKANTIINIKEQSKYLGDAYLVMGKARYLEGNYFDAVEYLDYVIRSYGSNNVQLKQEALIWKARALLYLNNLEQAKVAIDTAILNINPKKKINPGIYAAKLQYDINIQNYPDAEEDAKQAIQYCHDSDLKLRWTFILAQLQELNLKPGDAFENYTRVVKSNVVFEMAFNANLNRIRIQDNQNGVKTSKIDRLRSLLKNQNNDEFQDQIYYQIAEQFFASGDIDNALKNYKLSVRKNLKNQNQKGLSYLRIADIEFKNKADYSAAKLYYDSTLTYLSTTYPGYQIIKKKSNNLQILTGLLQTISREDTLQMLASLDEKTRMARIDAMVTHQILQEKAANEASTGSVGTDDAAAQRSTQLQDRQRKSNQATGNIFYFYNPAALSQGVNDFKRQWGNRRLEDNWRRSKRSNGNIAPANNNNVPLIAQGGTDPDGGAAPTDKNAAPVTAGSFRQELMKDLPLTPELLKQSNDRLYNAYMDLGNFYRDLLGDKKEAITTYELLLARFPNGVDKAAVYYNLYRLYADIDIKKSTDYKNRILKEFPESVYAKVILDPDYAKKLDDVNAEFNGYYNQIYDLYTQKKFAQVITKSNELLAQYPDSRFAAQLYYLKTIAAGHQEKLPPFMTDLQQIVTKYPNDKLITPLAVQHLAYIDANKAEVAARPVVLYGDDINEIPFTPPVAYQKQTEYRPVYKPSMEAPVAQVRLPEKVKQPDVAPLTAPGAKPSVTALPGLKQPVTSAVITPPATDSVKTVTQDLPVAVETTKQDSAIKPAQAAIVAPTITYIFNTRDSTNYYFGINVTTGTTNLSSSRFGIGQFNRTRFSASGIKHGLKAIGRDDQLIFVGRFYSLEDAKKYARGIIPLLPDIMKVPKDKYSFFIITQENLDKLADQKTLDSYIDYYQKFY